MSAPRSEFKGGIGALAASCLGVAFGLASIGATYTLGSFVKPLSQTFGWGREAIMNVIAFLTLGMTPAALFSGWIVDRVGPYRLILFSQAALGLTFIALGVFTSSLATLYGLYFLVALFGSGTLPITFGKTITERFTVHRGLALGIVLCGTGVCALIVPPYLTAVLGALGWRAAYVAVGLLPIVIGMPLTWMFLRGGASRAAELPANQGPKATGSILEVFRNYRTYVLCVIFFLISGVATSVLTNLIPWLQERGLSGSAAAGTLSLFGLVVIVGRLTAGALVDKFWAPVVGCIFLIPAAVALNFFGAPGLDLRLVPFLVIPVALATGMELDLSAYLVARYFNPSMFGRLYALLFIAIVVGGAVAAKLFGRVHDISGSYSGAFSAASFAFAGAGALLLVLGRYPSLAGAANLLNGDRHGQASH